MEKYQNKYRIPSARMQGWDYANEGAYFITICTTHRFHYFGEIENNKMKLSEIGKIVELEWLKTFEMCPDMNLIMGVFVIMPNHFHAIVIIGENQYNSQWDIDYKNKFESQSKNLASIVRGFKIGVTKNAHIINPNFAWQSSFHDHIIRNDQEFQQIISYIENNPENWEQDQFFKLEEL